MSDSDKEIPFIPLWAAIPPKPGTPGYTERDAFYDANKERLIAEHPFKYVAVYENKIGGVYETYDATYHAHEDMIIAKKCSIRRVDPPLSYFIPDWKELGYINGDI